MLTVVVILLSFFYVAYSYATYPMVLVGGGLADTNTEIWNTIINLSGGKGIAKIGVVSAASEDPCCDSDSSYVYYAGMLSLYGAAETYFIPITVDTKAMNVDPTVIENIKNMTGFMFGGGDQLRIIESFYNGDNYNIVSPALTAILETAEATGGVIAGTSAGTDCQTSKIMIAGGYSYYGLDDGVDIIDNPEDISKNTRTVTAYSPGGIGAFEYGLVDTHYANRGRQGRTMALLMDSLSYATTSPHAFGIDENTALVVTGIGANRIGTVIGERSVFVLDATYASGTSYITESKRNGRTINNMRASRLTHNDTINLSTYEITFASYKSALDSSSTDDLYHSKDIFESDATFEFDKVVDSLLQSTAVSSYGVTSEKTPRYKITMNKSIQSDAITDTVTAVGGLNTDSKSYDISYDGLWISVSDDDSL